jgi:hypothetical protein
MAFGLSIRSTTGGAQGAAGLNRVMDKISKDIEKKIDQLGKDIQVELRDKQTPYRTKNRGTNKGKKHTANYWDYKNKRNGFKIDNDRPWIGTLNEGNWVSSSKKGGGPSPRSDWVQSTIKKKTRSKR